MNTSNMKFRTNEAATLSGEQLSSILARRMPKGARADLVYRDMSVTENGIIRPFSPNKVAVFRSGDKDLPPHRFAQIATGKYYFNTDRGISLSHEDTLGFFPRGTDPMELLGPTSKMDENAFHRGSYTVTRVMAHDFLKKAASFVDFDGFVCVGLLTHVDAIADLVKAQVPSEDLAKAFLKSGSALDVLFPDTPPHVDLIYKSDPGSRVIALIAGTRDDGTFRYPMGGVVWKPCEKGFMVADNTYPDMFSYLRCNLILVKPSIDQIADLAAFRKAEEP